MRKHMLIGLFIISIVLSGCWDNSYTARVNQPLDNVVSIYLLDTHNNEEDVLYILKESEIEEFWNQLMALEFRRYFNDPPTEYGILAVKVYYADGHFDVIGTDINGYYDP